METEAAPQTSSRRSEIGRWELTGYRSTSLHDSHRTSTDIYERSRGEGTWLVAQHGVTFSPTMLPAQDLRINAIPSGSERPKPDPIGLRSAGIQARAVSRASCSLEVYGGPNLTRSSVPELPTLAQLEPAAAFQHSLVGQLACALAYEVASGTSDRSLADSLLAALAVRVSQHFGAEQIQRQPDLPRLRLDRVLDYIDAHLGQVLTLAELANVACLSRYHFSRSFKEAYGVGPQRYTVRRRVERAKALLRRGDDALASIAIIVGFADQSHFTAAFRRETGTTPGQFRAVSEQTAKIQ